MPVRVTIDAVEDVLRSVRDLTGQRVLVGVPSATANRRPGQGQKVAINNAALAYIHNFGSPARNIPARPFMTQALERMRPQVVRMLRRSAQLALDGERVEASRSLNAVGLYAQGMVQNEIVVGGFKPLSPRTLAERRARGVTRTEPLRDTGQLRQAIRYVISRKQGS